MPPLAVTKKLALLLVCDNLSFLNCQPGLWPFFDNFSQNYYKRLFCRRSRVFVPLFWLISLDPYQTQRDVLFFSGNQLFQRGLCPSLEDCHFPSFGTPGPA